ncbi:hypothetical protein QN362_10325 [Actimicrobium sp. CCC2.4]|uniref:hypothetical protein n=1 Tax=Actimicrobium sp. CCC2.4 TaxID=3048606 RepID=UPI002AC8ACB2|nr:hypothetical protein [Actimicrobium sp. CCC2.4]MEB0135723.1 hypothetical protein [Actimicrobium sp. CCC2.4]WPX33720.1 hypothetical protein RHM62_07845 [Actimicrobium sp. CCC2.4]
MTRISSTFAKAAIALVEQDSALQQIVAECGPRKPQQAGQPGTLHKKYEYPSAPDANYDVRYFMGVTPGQRAEKANESMLSEKITVPAHNDAHYHPWNYVQKGIQLEETVLRMDQIGCKYAVVMPIPTSIISLQGDKLVKISCKEICDPEWHHCGEEYYIPKAYNSPELELTPKLVSEVSRQISLNVDSEVDDTTADEFRSLKKEHRERLDPMITGLHLGSSFCDIALYKKLSRLPGIFTGAGELTLTKELVEDLFAGEEAQAKLPGTSQAAEGIYRSNIEPAKQLMAAMGVANMPACIHSDVDTWDAGQVTPGKPKYLDAMSNFFGDEKVKNTTIVWAHAGGLGRFVVQPRGHVAAMDKLLERHPNLVLDISWSKVARQLVGRGLPGPEKAERLGEWTDFLNKHSARIMFGSDALAPATNKDWTETLVAYRSLLTAIEPEARDNILNKTYERIYVDARKEMRKFENLVLPVIQHLLSDPNVLRLNIAKITELRDRIYSSVSEKVLEEAGGHRAITDEDVAVSISNIRDRIGYSNAVEARETAKGLRAEIRRIQTELNLARSEFGSAVDSTPTSNQASVSMRRSNSNPQVSVDTKEAAVVIRALNTEIKELRGQIAPLIELRQQFEDLKTSTNFPHPTQIGTQTSDQSTSPPALEEQSPAASPALASPMQEAQLPDPPEPPRQTPRALRRMLQKVNCFSTPPTTE